MLRGVIKKKGDHLVCLVFVSLNEDGVRSGIPAHASVRRPEVESGIHLVCLVFSGGSGPSDKGGRGGGGGRPWILHWSWCLSSNAPQ